MRKFKTKTFITSKFSLLNKTQIKKFDYFSVDSIAVDALNEEKFAFKNLLKSSKIINFIKQSSKTTTLKFKTTTLIKKKTNETHYMHDAKMKTFVTFKFSSSNKTQIKKFDYFSINSIAVDALN